MDREQEEESNRRLEVKTYTGNLRRRHMTLVEVLVYMSLVALVSGLAIRIFFGGMDAAATVRSSSERVLNTFRQGDRWREDIQKAKRVEAGQDRTALRLVKDNGDIIHYRLQEHDLHRIRHDSENGRTATVVVKKVQNCRFTPFPADNPRGWKMALELQTKQDKSKIDPLFDFIAVPQQGGE